MILLALPLLVHLARPLQAVPIATAGQPIPVLQWVAPCGESNTAAPFGIMPWGAILVYFLEGGPQIGLAMYAKHGSEAVAPSLYGPSHTAVGQAQEIVDDGFATHVVLAFGTLDIANFLSTPQEVFEALREAQELIGVGLPSARVFIAHVPPVMSCIPNDVLVNLLIDDLNVLISAWYPPGRVLQFNSSVNQPFYFQADCLHLNPLGQWQWALEAQSKLFP